MLLEFELGEKEMRNLTLKSIFLFVALAPLHANAEGGQMEANDTNCFDYLLYGIEGLCLEECGERISDMIQSTDNDVLKDYLITQAQQVGLVLTIAAE